MRTALIVMTESGPRNQMTRARARLIFVPFWAKMVAAVTGRWQSDQELPSFVL